MKRLRKGARRHAWYKIKVEKLKVLSFSMHRLAVSFRQSYARPGYSDLGIKTLLWVKEGGHWKIKRESWKAAGKK